MQEEREKYLFMGMNSTRIIKKKKNEGKVYVSRHNSIKISSPLYKNTRKDILLHTAKEKMDLVKKRKRGTYITTAERRKENYTSPSTSNCLS